MSPLLLLSGCLLSSGPEPTPSCDAYVECSAAVSPDTLGPVLDTYGPDGTCWSDDETAATCDDACVTGLEAERADTVEEACWATAPACQVLEAADRLCDTISGPLTCGGADEACRAQVVRACPADAIAALGTCVQDAGDPGVLLVIDYSDSMLEELEEAAGAAAPFLDALPGGTPVAVVGMDAAESAGAPIGESSVGGGSVSVLEDQLGCTDCAGPAIEEGLEAAWLALCRTQPSLAESCLETGLLSAADADTVPELSDIDTVHVVIVSDEGDTSRRLEREPEATLYVDLFASLPMRVVVHVVVPGLDADGNVVCPGTALSWGVQRYHDAAERTLGMSFDVSGSQCDGGDIEGALLSIAEGIE